MAKQQDADSFTDLGLDALPAAREVDFSGKTVAPIVTEGHIIALIENRTIIAKPRPAPTQ